MTSQDPRLTTYNFTLKHDDGTVLCELEVLSATRGQVRIKEVGVDSPKEFRSVAAFVENGGFGHMSRLQQLLSRPLDWHAHTPISDEEYKCQASAGRHFDGRHP